jgi:hypothetical protein
MRRLVVAVALLVVAGCGESRVPVQGRVVWTDGSPANELAGGLVQLQTADGMLGPRGVIGPDASFQLTSDTGMAGAAPGDYRVFVVETRAVLKETDEGAVQAPPRMDPKHEHPDTSGLTATIPPGGGNITVTVSRAPGNKKK